MTSTSEQSRAADRGPGDGAAAQGPASASPAHRPRVPAWVFDACAIIVVAVTATVPGPRPPSPHPALSFVLPAIVIVVSLVLVPLRRRWPIAALGASLLLYVVTALIGAPSTGIGIVAILAAYTVGQRTSRRTVLIAGGAATAIVALLSVSVSNFGVVDPRVFQIAAALAVAAALGDSSRSHREFVRVAAERAERAEQTREAEAQRRVAEERLRIARDLHDTVAHEISVISLNSGVASGSLETNPEKARAALGTIRTSARGALREIGDLLRYLRAGGGVDGGADGASLVVASLVADQPQPAAANLETLVSRMTESGLDVTLRTDGDLGRVTGATGGVLFRIVQEALTNAHKHGSGGVCSVDIVVGGVGGAAAGTAASADAATVTITNPVAVGERNQVDPPSGGYGLVGIRERVASVGGTVTAGRRGTEFVLVGTLPLRAAISGTGNDAAAADGSAASDRKEQR